MSAPPTSFAEHVCLALISQDTTHGWALGSLLAPDGEVGRVWSLTRPLTYRAIDGLVDKGLITRRGTSTGSGRDRVLLAATAAGRRAAGAWLERPVEHLREVRTELLVKLLLRERAGLDNHELLERQAQRFAPTIDSLSAAHRDDDLVDLWRRESARAVRRFLDHALRTVEPGPAPRPIVRMSARNQLPATVTRVHHGAVMATVDAVLDERQSVTAVITRDAAADLDLAPGDAATLIVKSTDVIVAVGIEPAPARHHEEGRP